MKAQATAARTTSHLPPLPSEAARWTPGWVIPIDAATARRLVPRSVRTLFLLRGHRSSEGPVNRDASSGGLANAFRGVRSEASNAQADGAGSGRRRLWIVGRDEGDHCVDVLLRDEPAHDRREVALAGEHHVGEVAGLPPEPVGLGQWPVVFAVDGEDREVERGHV